MVPERMKVDIEEIEVDPLAPYYFNPDTPLFGVTVPSILEDYDENYPSIVDRFFTRYYYIKPGNGFAPYKVLVHSNRICLICLAPEHPAIQEGIVSLDFDSSGCDRSKNNVSGKGKKGAMVLQDDTTIAFIKTTTGHVYKVPSCIRSKLIEVNLDLAKNVGRMGHSSEGRDYIAIVLPKLDQIDNLLEKLMTQDEYNQFLANRNEMPDIEQKVDEVAMETEDQAQGGEDSVKGAEDNGEQAESNIEEAAMK